MTVFYEMSSMRLKRYQTLKHVGRRLTPASLIAFLIGVQKWRISLSSHHSRRSLSSTCQFREGTAAQRGRQWSTPLAKQLAAAISATGPVPVASYMRMCLTGDVGGYYTGAIGTERDQFGRKGDFVTSPEISQIFGELIGIWFVSEWMAQGRQSKGVELMELGPGRGTLMEDVLRTVSHFKNMAKSIDTIYMVEASAELRKAQKDLLCGKDAPVTETKEGYQSVSSTLGVPIIWTELTNSVPRNPERMPFVVAHEFFDALPIHAFQCVQVPLSQQPSPSTTPATGLSKPAKPTLEWRELLVSPTPLGSTHKTLCTPASQARETPPPDFQLSLAKATTRHSIYLPSSSPRYRAIRSHFGQGALIEICPDAFLHAADIAARIGNKPRPSGAALILDYGPGDGSVPTSSLRGIRAHRRVSPFAEPGLTDLSADVDFSAVAEAALQASEGVEVHGPVEQAAFLDSLGGRERTKLLVKRLKEKGEDGERQARDVQRAYERLVDRGPGGMGKVYKAMAVVPENDGKRRPVGFGGDALG